jgi:hypothetical protein
MRANIDHRLGSLLKQTNPGLYLKTKAHAELTGVSTSAIIEQALMNYFLLYEDEKHRFLLDLEQRIRKAKSDFFEASAAALKADGMMGTEEQIRKIIEDDDDQRWTKHFEF